MKKYYHLPIKKRLTFLSAAVVVGGFLFIPFLVSDSSSNINAELKSITEFILISTLITALTAWAGLRFADRIEIRMPVLRNWELSHSINHDDIRHIIIKSVLFGLFIAALVLAGNYIMHPPTNPGSFLARISTTIWAALVTETVAHLFVLSGLILLIKNKWAAIIISGLVFVVLFHLNSNYSRIMEIYLATVNFLPAIVTGYLFVTEGFECAVLTHMIMHFFMLAINK